MEVGEGAPAREQHDHNGYCGRLTVALATYRAGQRLALSGGVSTADLVRQRHEALERLTALAQEPDLDAACRLRVDAAAAEIASS
jgi:hypothetical protein